MSVALAPSTSSFDKLRRCPESIEGTASGHRCAQHIPVLLREAVEALALRTGGRYVDATLGGGAHAEAILRESEEWLLGIDADPEALRIATERLEPYRPRLTTVNDNFRNLEEVCRQHDFLPVQGILFDLGLSSYQLEDPYRGFSFQLDAPLDMRYSPSQPVTAADLVNNLSEARLACLIHHFGEERHSRLIARRIVENRPLRSSLELARVVERAVGRRGRLHPATKTFLALRIAVNQELESLELALKQAVNLLDQGGRLVVISFQSLEDRLVKEFLRRESQGCICPPAMPVCTCGHVPTLKLVSRKAVLPSPAELRANPRSRSAKMRVAEKL